MKQIIVILSILLVIFSCRKEDAIDNNPSTRLEFSQDTVLFDTVFSTVGSVTQWLTIRNKSSKKVVISSISILGGTKQFRMNVDGVSGRTITNMEIPANDSIFMFVEVTVNPNSQLLPFLITDQIQFITNGNDQRIDLVAYGQNALFYTPDVFPRNLPDYTTTGNDPNVAETTIWTDSIPIVIYGYVVVDSLDVLIIRPGTQIYLHGGAGIWVYRGGSMRVMGEKDNEVVFQGDRLDEPYNELSGQWERIWINEGSFNNFFNYAIIKNAFIGIQAETLPFPPRASISFNKLELYNTIIENCSAVGLLTTNYRVDAKNTIISNCGAHNFAVTGGGEYNFDHCTFANYWTEDTRTTPAVILVNSYEDPSNNSVVGVPIDEANFRNCLIVGNNDSEFDFESIDESVALNFNMDHCIINTEADTNYTGGTFESCLLNANNQTFFVDPYELDFHLVQGSEAIDRGIEYSTSPNRDLDAVNRFQDQAPDLGAYEFAP